MSLLSHVILKTQTVPTYLASPCLNPIYLSATSSHSSDMPTLLSSSSSKANPPRSVSGMLNKLHGQPDSYDKKSQYFLS